MRRHLGVLLAAFALALLVVPSPGNAQSSWTGVIDAVTREAIYRYYQGDKYPHGTEYEHGKKSKKNKGQGGSGKQGLPPGLAKRDSLPPGLQKQLTEKGTLPPGLAKRELPPDLLKHIKVPKGDEFFIVDDNVVLIEKATGVVLDVLEGVLRR